MNLTEEIFGYLAILATAYVVGALITKIKLPAILGWLIAGMCFGPYLGGLVSNEFLAQEGYKIYIHVFEGFAGVMIGSEIRFSELKKSGRQLVITTLFQSLGTFLVVSLCFLIALSITGDPLYLSVIFGGIALATAPAPALSIVNQYHTDGPVTRTLIPMAVLDDVVGIIVFFTVISIIGAVSGAGTIAWWKIVLSVILPIVVGVVFGFLFSWVAKPIKNRWVLLSLFTLFILMAVATGVVIDKFLFGTSLMNYLLMTMALSLVSTNKLDKEKNDHLIKDYNPILSLSLIVVIVNLGMPLDYHTITGAGVFTAVYILARALGKIGGAALGAHVTHMDKNVEKYLGLTLLPHSGVSLVFTSIAVNTIQATDPEAAALIQGTIAAAAVLNEIVAVILAKVGFTKAGEIGKADQPKAEEPAQVEASPGAQPQPAQQSQKK